MDACALSQLTEDVFSKLCNIALEKCHDKSERRRAGCGGHAMRKRVLIKNFVADLLRAQNERRLSTETLSSTSDDEEQVWEEEPEEEVDEDEEEEEEDEGEEEQDDEDEEVESDEEEVAEEDEVETARAETTPLPSLMPPQTRTFVDSDPSLSSLFPDYLDSTSDSISVPPGLPDCKMSSEDRLWMYDMYGSESSESAYAPSSLLSTWTPEWTMLPGYDGGFSSTEDTLVPPTSIYDPTLYLDPSGCFSTDLSGSLFCAAQPVRAEAQDQIFLALSTNHLAEMKAYTPDMVLPDDLTTPTGGYSVTDLDAPEPAVATPAEPTVPSCKRAPSEPTSALYTSSFNTSSTNTAKRIKL